MTTPLPQSPRWAAAALLPLPLAPLSIALTAFARRLGADHPALFRRLGVYGDARFVLVPTDLPLQILIEPRGGNAPRVHLSHRFLRGDARITGPLSALLGMVHGAYDGDALFFARDLVIEGDTAAVLALRNAIDDAELDLGAQVQAIAGRLKRPVQWAIAQAEARTGFALHRFEETAQW